MQEFLSATPFIDSNHPTVISYAQKHGEGLALARDKVIAIYYAVRDEFRYNPYSLDLTVEGMRASTVLASGEGWCVNKAILLAACCRAIGVPARLGFADVVNHLSSAKLREKMGSNVFKWHGYTSIFIDGQWLKATPAFNIELCDKAGIHALEFDGLHDSIYHEFDKAGNKHMEYQKFRGEFADLPLKDMTATFEREYSQLNAANVQGATKIDDIEDFHEAVARERNS